MSTAEPAASASRLRLLLAAAFGTAGVLHFVTPKPFEAIVPDYLPLHREAVIASGVAEIAGAAMLLPASTRTTARWWLLGLLAAVFPANIWMATNTDDVKGLPVDRIPEWALWARLPLQFVLAGLVWRATAQDAS